MALILDHHNISTPSSKTRKGSRIILSNLTKSGLSVTNILLAGLLFIVISSISVTAGGASGGRSDDKNGNKNDISSTHNHSHIDGTVLTSIFSMNNACLPPVMLNNKNIVPKKQRSSYDFNNYIKQAANSRDNDSRITIGTSDNLKDLLNKTWNYGDYSISSNKLSNKLSEAYYEYLYINNPSKLSNERITDQDSFDNMYPYVRASVKLIVIDGIGCVSYTNDATKSSTNKDVVDIKSVDLGVYKNIVKNDDSNSDLYLFNNSPNNLYELISSKIKYSPPATNNSHSTLHSDIENELNKNYAYNLIKHNFGIYIKNNNNATLTSSDNKLTNYNSLRLKNSNGNSDIGSNALLTDFKSIYAPESSDAADYSVVATLLTTNAKEYKLISDALKNNDDVKNYIEALKFLDYNIRMKMTGIADDGDSLYKINNTIDSDVTKRLYISVTRSYFNPKNKILEKITDAALKTQLVNLTRSVISNSLNIYYNNTIHDSGKSLYNISGNPKEISCINTVIVCTGNSN